MRIGATCLTKLTACGPPAAPGRGPRNAAASGGSAGFAGGLAAAAFPAADLMSGILIPDTSTSSSASCSLSDLHASTRPRVPDGKRSSSSSESNCFTAAVNLPRAFAGLPESSNASASSSVPRICCGEGGSVDSAPRLEERVRPASQMQTPSSMAPAANRDGKGFISARYG